MATEFDIVGGFSASKYEQFNSQRTINMYVKIDENAKNQKSLITFPGHKTKISPPEGALVRKMFVNNNNLYDVSSTIVYKIDSALNPTRINGSLPLNTSSGYIGIDANSNNEIIFVDGTGGYLYKNSDNTFSSITESNFPSSPTDVVFFDGYFIANVGGTNKFRLSNPNDGSTWTFEGQPREALFQTVSDTIIGFAVIHSRLYVFGQYSTELWYNAGAAIVPFLPDKNTSLDFGCAALGSIATGHQLLFWLSKTKDGIGPVVMTDGASPAVVSNEALDNEFQSYSKIDDAIGFVFKISGHIFYLITFPTADKTWLFDVNTKLWSELEALDGSRHPANCHAYFAGKHLIGDYQTRNIFELSDAYYDHDGTRFKWKRITKNLSSPTYKRMRVNKIQVDTNKGRANSSGDNEDPKIYLGASRDGGATYLGLQKQIYTKIGKYKTRCIWDRQGVSDDWVFSFEGYNNLPFILSGCSIDYEELNT